MIIDLFDEENGFETPGRYIQPLLACVMDTRAGDIYTCIHIYIYIHIRHGEVRCTPLDFPGFSQGCGRALNRVEGGRRIRVEGRTAASERMVMGEEDEEDEEKEDEEMEAAWGGGDGER